MKKLISYFMVFLICFSMFTRIDQKKPEAITLVAGYSIAQILGAMALSATVVGAGYAVTDSLVNPEDNSEFTDFLQTVFKQTLDLSKYEVPPPPEPLGTLESATLLGLLTQQGIEVSKELYAKVYKYFKGEEPYPVRSILNGKRYIGEVNNGLETYYILDNEYTKFYEVGDYIQSNGWVLKRTGNDVLGFDSVWIPKETNLTAVGSFLGNVVIRDGIYSDTISTRSPVSLNLKVDKEPLPDSIKEPLNMVEPDSFQNTFKNVDLSPLNGLVKSPDELIDIINGVKKVPSYVYGKISDAFNMIYDNYLKNPNFIGADAPLSPIADPNTGTLYFGDPKLDEPELDTDPMPDELSALNKALFWLKGIWQSIRDLPKNIANEIGNIFQYLKNFIERFWQTFTEWWQDNFLYHWTLFIEWLHTLPNLIANALTPLFDLLMIPINAIVSAINNIGEFLIGLPELFVDLLKDLFIWLFVPDPEFLKDKVDIFKENFTFIDSFKQFILLFDDMTSQNRVPTITLDFSKFKGSLGGQPISMGGQAFVLDMRFYDTYRAIGDIMITAFVYLMFAWRFFGRLPEIISGGGLLYTADNKTNDIINKLEGKKK